MNHLEKLFENTKYTENGDLAYKSSTNPLVDILFTTPYLEKNLNEVSIGTDTIDKVFAMFVRDPRHGLGRRDLGRELMKQAGVSVEDVITAGRFDDLYTIFGIEGLDIVLAEAEAGNHLAKKWLPRYTSGKKAKALSIQLMNRHGLSVREYQQIIKTDTVETLLNAHTKNVFGENTYHRRSEIDFEKVPSLARIKWSKKFREIPHYEDYMNKVVSGEAKMNFSVGTVYDVYKALEEAKISPVEGDMAWKQLDKVKINAIPIVDTSGSMYTEDARGKALSVGTAIAQGSTYVKDQFITFSRSPELVKLHGNTIGEVFRNMWGADWGMNTDLGKVFDLLSELEEFPEYLVILSDMEFDVGSTNSKDQLMSSLKNRGINTKIVWWNFNTRSQTFPETDKYGNIFMSGYSPQMLNLLENGFDSEAFLMALLQDYLEKIGR